VEYGVQERFFAQKWEPNPAEPFALFVGTAEPRKGLQDLVAAFAHPRLASHRLCVLGDGPVLRQMQAQALPNIEWLGRVSREETVARMSRAWCLVLPTRADTSPNVVKEARVIGLPVITSPHGGQRDYVFDGENGWIVDTGDIETLADRLARTLGDFQLARRLGENRHAEQREFFRPQNTAAAFLELYRRYTAA
jgi:glycosyltransferase involved in cell wall biosynthesis